MKNFVVSIGFDAKEGKTRDLQKWLGENEEKIAADCPTGCEYLGTYVAVYGANRSAGTLETLWGMDSYGAQDNFTQAMKDGGTFARLMEEFAEFQDQRNEANWSTKQLRRITDAAIWGE